MRKYIAILCIFLGILFILNSVGIIINNHLADEKAEEASQDILQKVKSIIDKNQTNFDKSEMTFVEIEDYDCIGILSIPALDLEMPVLKDWSYSKLKKAPCLYYGSYREKDFVIAAHNYNSHFGRLSKLQAGDSVLFQDVSGASYFYEVVLIETLPQNATEEMITSGFDLSLYTCTLGGSNRITVRCNIIKH